MMLGFQWGVLWQEESDFVCCSKDEDTDLHILIFVLDFNIRVLSVLCSNQSVVINREMETAWKEVGCPGKYKYLNLHVLSLAHIARLKGGQSLVRFEVSQGADVC